MTKQNIVFIYIESFDGRQLGFWGDPALKRATPNLDKVAREGTIFSNNYTTHPICCPARASMWTGTYSFRHETWNNHKGLEPGTRRFQHVLEAEGYIFASKKGGIGKHDYMSGRHSMKARVGGWTGPLKVDLPLWKSAAPRIIGKKMFLTSKTNGMDWSSLWKARRFLTRNARVQAKARERGEDNDASPFFLYLSLVLPHPSYVTHARWLDNIDIDAISIPKPEHYQHPVVEFQKRLKNWTHGFDEATVRKTRAVYYGMLSETDAIVGEIVKTMHQLGLDENTYLVISSDHGDNQLEHGQSLKSNMFESAAKVPLIIKGPGIPAGKICTTPVDTTDLAPTFLDMAGVPADNVKERYELDFNMDGESLLPLMRGDARAKEHAFSMYTGIGTCTAQFMLRRGEWKYIAFPGYEPLLFNLDDDPGELVDRSATDPGIVASMDARLREIVDYNAVNEKHVEYCKTALRTFEQDCIAGNISYKRGGKVVKGTGFEDVMRLLYKGWNEEHARELRAFMA